MPVKALQALSAVPAAAAETASPPRKLKPASPACKPEPASLARDVVLHGDNLQLLQTLPSESVRLIYIDPPFNTGRVQSRPRLKTVAAANGARVGFGGKRYSTQVLRAAGELAYDDSFNNYVEFLQPRLEQAHRILMPDGSLFFHIDWREAANCRLLLERIFGGARHCMNEIIWAYDYGARSRKNWSPKHDNIYWFAKNPREYVFNYDTLARIPYMAPGLVGEEKAALGKTPTDVWWHTIVPPSSREKTGYPTQKPIDILRWLIAAHSAPGDTVLDFFAGSGTCGAAAKQLKRHYILIDSSKAAVDIMNKRLQAMRKAEAPHAVNGYGNAHDDGNGSVNGSGGGRGKKNGKAALSPPSLQQVMCGQLAQAKSTQRPDRSAWAHSPQSWLSLLSPARKGKIGRQLVYELLAHLCGRGNVSLKGASLFIGGKKAAVKFSLLWESGEYHFEQLKKNFAAYCLCGLSPSQEGHLWLVPAAEYDNFEQQRSRQSRWVSVHPHKSGGGRKSSGGGGGIPWHKYGGALSAVNQSHLDFLLSPEER